MGAGRLTIGVHAALSAGNLRATLVEHRRRFIVFTEKADKLRS
jgi:hypothetical protein